MIKKILKWLWEGLIELGKGIYECNKIIRFPW